MDAICKIIVGKCDKKKFVNPFRYPQNFIIFPVLGCLKNKQKNPQILKSVGLKRVYYFSVKLF